MNSFLILYFDNLDAISMLWIRFLIVLNISNYYIIHFINLMIPIKKLSVSIHDAEFAKDFQYFISGQFQSQKKITDVSAIARNPIFTNNTFIFDLMSSLTIKANIIFIVHIISEDEEPENSKRQAKSKSKILGECVLDLTAFGLQPTEQYNLPIRQQIKFVRVKQGREINVGRCIVSFKIVGEDEIPTYLEQLEYKKIQKKQIYTQLPDYDQTMSFKWRVKVQIRSATNLPSTNNVTPQASVEVGWTQYKNSLPQSNRIYSTSILNSNNPQWNQSILIENPSHVQNIKGFLMLLMKDDNNLEDIIRIYIPLESMGKFIPYNLKVFQGKDTISPIELLISLVLEAPQNSRQRLHDLIISDIIFQPQITPFKSMSLALTTSGNDPLIEFYPFKPSQNSIQRILQFDEARQFTYFMSQQMKIPPIKSSKQYRAATIITVPESFFKKQLNFYLVGIFDRKFKICGITEQVQKDLISLCVQKTKKRLFLQIRNFTDLKMGKCQLQISDKTETKIKQINGSRATSRRGEETATQKLMKDLKIQSNESLYKHITQNNQIIGRILRELDDKSESLKQAASQIVSLRGKVKLLQNQNSILRRKALGDEDQLVNLVQRQIQTMSERDLKDKIVKLSQLYKSQRIKTRQLDKALKVLQPQVSNTMQLNSIISSQKNNIQILEGKIEKASKDLERVTIYKETIKKQEKVIEKLERVMREGMEEMRKAKQTRLELEQLKKRGGIVSHHNSQTRDQIQRLQKIIADLQSNKPINLSNVSDNNTYELQFKLHQAQTRIQYLEEELQEKAKSFARQLAIMKMKVAEKEAILDGFSK